MSGLTWIAFLSFLLGASAFDLKTRRLPNWLLGIGALSGLLFSFWQAGTWGVKLSLLGLLFGVLLLIIPFACRLLGAGDVKLLGVIGAFSGPAGALYAFLWGSIAGGFLAIGSLAWSKAVDSEGSAKKLSYGPALAVGGLCGALWVGFAGGAL